MTPQERLAALKALLKGLEEPLVYVDGDLHQQTERYGVKVVESVPSRLVQELCLCVDGCEYHAIKSHDGVPCCMVLRSEQGYNHFQAAHRTRVRAGEWVQAEIAKMEQPAPAKTSSALPYKVLLNSMESKMGYDSDLRLEYLLISTDENDSKMLKQDISGELVASTNSRLALIDESLYMYFKTGDHDVAKEMKAKVVEWLKKRIAETEQPPFDPKEVIEAAAADQEGMDAAESEVDREQMRTELRTLWKTVGRQEAELLAMEQSRDGYRRVYQEALAAAEAQRISKDDEIAALKKDLQDRIRQHVGLSHEYVELHAEHENLQAVSWAKEAVKDKKIEQLQADLQATNLSKDNKIAQLSHEVLSLNSVLTSLANELAAMKNAAEPKDVQPAPVRLPAAGDTIEIPSVHGPVGTWDKVVTYMKCGEVKYDAGPYTPTADEYGLKRGMWRWPGPRTRTAADAKMGEIVLFWDTIQTRDHGPVIGLGDSSVFVQASDGKVHRLPHHEFGPTGWRFEKEQLK